MARRRLLKSYFYIVYNGVAYGETATVSPFNETGGTDLFTIVTNRSWEVVDCPSWATLSANGGEKGDTNVISTNVTITVSANEGTTGKNGVITVRTLDQRYTGYLNISQNGFGAFITIDNASADKSVQVAFRDEEEAFVIASRGGWDAVVTNGTANVVEVPGGEGVDTRTVTISYNKNTGATEQVITMVLTSKTDSSIVRTITITQAPQSYVDIVTENIYLPYNGQTGTITVSSNIGGSIENSADQANRVELLNSTFVNSTSNSISYSAKSLDNTYTAETAYAFTITAKTSDYMAEDGIDSDVFTFTYEPYPYINANAANIIESATTAGNIPYTTNYPVQITNVSQGISVALNGSNVEYTLPANTNWEDVSYSFDIVTVPYSTSQPDGVRGPAISKTVTVTRKANVAYINANNATAPSTGGSFYVDVDTNDTFTVEIGTGADWITLDRIEGNRAYFNISENDATDSRNVPITFKTEHNGADGQPASKEITLTQSGTGITPVNATVNVDLYQDLNGRWWINASQTEQGAVIPIGFTYGGTETTLNVAGAKATADTQTQWSTAAGTAINTGSITTPSSVIVGNYEYNLTYAYNVVPYSETTEITIDNVNLSYDVDEISAGGGTSTPSLTVDYTVKTTPSYGEISTDTYTNVSINNFSVDGTGDINADNTVSADTRANIEGAAIDIANITGVTFEIDGESFTETADITISQEENIIVDDNPTETSEQSDVETSRSESYPVYTEVGIWITPSTHTFGADGGEIGISATESGYTQDFCDITYDVVQTAVTTHHYTYTSGYYDEEGIEDEPVITTISEGLEKSEAVSNERFYEDDVTENIVEDTSATYISLDVQNGIVTADNLGTNETTGETLTLTVTSDKDSSLTDSATFEQEANTYVEIEGAVESKTDTGTGGTRDYSDTEYTRVYIVPDGGSFLANGKVEGDETDNISVNAYEEYNIITGVSNEIITSSWTETAVTKDWASGEVEQYVKKSDIDVNSEWVIDQSSLVTASTGTNDITQYVTTTGTEPDHIHYSPYDEGSGDGTVYADNLENNETAGETLTLYVESPNNPSLSDTAEFSQEGNQVESTGTTEPVPEYGESQCNVVPDSSEVEFTNSVRTIHVGATVSLSTYVEYNTYQTSTYTSGYIETGATPTTTSSGTKVEYVEPSVGWSAENMNVGQSVSLTTLGDGRYDIVIESDFTVFDVLDAGDTYVGDVRIGIPGYCSEDINVYIYVTAPQNSVESRIDYDSGPEPYYTLTIYVDPEFEFGPDISWSTTCTYDFMHLVDGETVTEERSATFTGTGLTPDEPSTITITEEDKDWDLDNFKETTTITSA